MQKSIILPSPGKSASEPLVTLYLEQTPQLIATMLALMKLGWAFQLFNPNEKNHTIDRVYEQICLSDSLFLITHKHLFLALNCTHSIKNNSHFSQIQAVKQGLDGELVPNKCQQYSDKNFLPFLNAPL